MKFNTRRTDIPMERILKHVVDFHQRPRHTTPEEFENAGFTLKTHQMFSVHTTSEEFKNAKIAGYFGFVLKENSVREVT